MAYISSSRCRVAESPGKYMHQVNRLKEITQQRLSLHVRDHWSYAAGANLPMETEADSKRSRQLQEASWLASIMAARNKSRSRRSSCVSRLDQDPVLRPQDTPISTLHFGAVSIHLAGPLPEPPERDSGAVRSNVRVSGGERRRSETTASSNKVSKAADSTITRNPEKPPQQMTNAQRNNTLKPDTIFPRSQSEDVSMRNKARGERQISTTQLMHTKSASGPTSNNNAGVPGADDTKTRVQAVRKGSASSQLKAAKATVSSPNTGHAWLQPTSASSLPKRAASNAERVTPFGSKSHNYSPQKKCPSSIYNSRLQEERDMAEYRKRLQEYESQVCLHCSSVYPDGRCRQTKDCWHYRKKLEENAKVSKESKESQESKGDKRGKLETVLQISETFLVDDLPIKSISNILMEVQRLNEAKAASLCMCTSQPKHEDLELDSCSYSSDRSDDTSLSGNTKKKFVVAFEDRHKTTCTITVKKSALIPESPNLIRLLTVEVDITLKPPSATTSPSRSSSYAESYGETSAKEKNRDDAMSTLSGLSSCFDDLNDARSFEDYFGEAQGKESPELSKPKTAESEIIFKMSSCDSSSEMRFGRLSQFCEIAVTDLGISLEKIKTKKGTRDTGSAAKTARTKASWSGESKRFGCPTILKGRPVVEACFCPMQPDMLLTLHSEPDNDPGNFKGMLISVWNTDRPSHPRCILTAGAKLTCMCFSPLTAATAFACMNDGSVGLWDLDEPDSLHQIFSVKKEKFILRYPTYCTPHGEDCQGHSSPAWSIVAVFPVSSRRPHLKRVLTLTSPSTPFQIATVEEAGIIIFWQVERNAPAENEAKAMPMSKARGHQVKLVMNLKIRLTQEFPSFLRPVSLGTLFLRVNHLDPDGTAILSKCGFYKRKPHYKPVPEPQIMTGPTLGMSSLVQCVDFSPYDTHYFLVGYDDGRVFLCHVEREEPVLCIPAPPKERKPALKVQWSPSRPTVFFVLHGDSALNIFDLYESTQHPVRTLHINDGPLLTMALSPDFTNPYFPKRPAVLLAGANGLIVLRELNKVATDVQDREEEEFLKLLGEDN